MTAKNQVMRQFVIVPALTILAVLSGCGGGGGGSATADYVEAASSVNVGQEQDINNLRIAEENRLSLVDELDVEVQVDAQRSFLSICDAPGEPFKMEDIDYDQCILRAPLDADQKTFSIKLPHHIDRLAAIIWFYDVGKKPLIKIWQRDDSSPVAMSGVWRVNQD